MPQIWDELRRKVNSAQQYFQPGAETSHIIDDFGDVYGILLSVTGIDYSNKEIHDYLDLLRRQLVLVPGIKKVAIDGNINEQIIIEVSQQKIVNMGIDSNKIIKLINEQNVVSNAGAIFNGVETIRLHPTGEYQKLSDLKNLIVSDENSKSLITLADIANIKRDFTEKPQSLYYFNGKPALTLGISFADGVNVVEVGKDIKRRLNELENQRPLGINVSTVYNQAEIVDRSINDFLLNLAEAIAIVVAVLLIFMGLRSGIIMGAILLLTILGTFIIMKLAGIQLQKISLGALIIALGMLVDNAIVITEGILINLKRGLSKIDAAKQVVNQTKWPLLGATIIAVTAFAPIGLSQDGTGEFANSLFWVLLISLSLSWLTAITITPFLCNLILKENKANNSNDAELYKGAIFTVYKHILNLCLKQRILTLIITIIALSSSVWGFTKVKNVFFPPSTTPIYFVDYWLPQGTDIRNTAKSIANIEQKLLKMPEIKQITTVIGKGAQRFVLPYNPEKSYQNYGQLIVETENLTKLDLSIIKTVKTLRNLHPEARYTVKKLENGPSPAAKIEARFMGSDPRILRELGSKAIDIIQKDSWSDSIRQNWQERTKIIRPEILETQARKAGVNKQDIDDAMLMRFSGKQIGVYRDRSTIMPIIARSPDKERLDPQSLYNIQLWSPKFQTYMPMKQVIDNFKFKWEDPLIIRRDRQRTISVLAEPIILSGETADSVFKRIRSKIEQLPLPDGYKLEWGGEHETAGEAQAGLMTSLPAGVILMFLITIFLFNTIRQPIVIWLTVPLALIGVVSWLLVFNAPFSFMALLGLLSLSGMLIKNGIVLVEQISHEEKQGEKLSVALVNAAISRVRPVSMAAITTVLGMIPLLFDDFFKSMAVTIIFGLAFATILVLIVLPVIYSIFYRISYSSETIN